MPRVDPYAICIRIVRCLAAQGPATEAEIAERVKQRQATVQKSLRLLLNQERISVSIDGDRRLYRYEY